MVNTRFSIHGSFTFIAKKQLKLLSSSSLNHLRLFNLLFLTFYNALLTEAAVTSKTTKLKPWCTSAKFRITLPQLKLIVFMGYMC